MVLTHTGLCRMGNGNPPLWVGEGSVSLGQRRPCVNQPGEACSLPAIACNFSAGLGLPSPIPLSYRELGDPHFPISGIGCTSGMNQGLGLGETHISLNHVGKDSVKVWKPERGRGQSSKASSVFIFA